MPSVFYSSSQKILLVGEGDFSFSASLAVSFGFYSASNMVATSLDSQEFLFENYAKAEENIAALRGRGCSIIHGLDATTMASHRYLDGMKFDRIVFNFPFAGFFKEESRESQIQRHRKLVRMFLENAKQLIKGDGEVHITHKTNLFHSQWDLPGLASNVGFTLLGMLNFDLNDFPGYNNKCGFGGDDDFCCRPSSTFKFGLLQEDLNSPFYYLGL